jgi:hypothetical protein
MEEKTAAAVAQRLYRLTMDRIRLVGLTTTPITLVTSQVTEEITVPLKIGNVTVTGKQSPVWGFVNKSAET